MIFVVFASLSVQKALEFVQTGSSLIKVRSKYGKYPRFFLVSGEGMVLEYKGSKKIQCWRRMTKNTEDQREGAVF